MKTFIPKVITNAERKWFVVDAAGKTVGKLAVEIANILRGKNKGTFTPHLDQGDYVIVINSEKVELTGKKMADKKYYKHTGYIGHLRETTAQELMEKDPTEVLKRAITGMIPRNKLRKDIMLRLKLVVGAEHKYEAQQPEAIEL